MASNGPFSKLSQLLGGKAEQKTLHLQEVEQSVSIQIEGHGELAEQMKMIGFDEAELRMVKQVQGLIEEHIEDIVSEFYRTVLNVKHLQQIIETYSTVDRLKQTLKTHLIEMFSGQIDEAFIQKRIRVAEAHVKIGLQPKWYMGAFQNLQNTLHDLIHRRVVDREEGLRISKVISKLLNFEQQLVLEAYEQGHERLRRIEQERKEQLQREINQVSEDLLALTEETSASIEELVASSEEVNLSMQSSSRQSLATQQMAEDGQQRIAALAHRIRAIHDNTNRMEATVQQLNESSAKIRNVVSLVHEIAEQTNLLAINSAIEAARAGEHGRGFSVVASEVQKLAEQTRTSVKQIANLIEESNRFTSEVVKGIREVQSLMAEGHTESESTRSAFDSIVQSMGGNIDSVQRVGEELRELVSVIQEIGRASEKVAASAEMLNETANRV